MTDSPSMFAAGIVELGPVPRLLGSHCGSCDRWFFPRKNQCRRCGGETLPVSLGSTGKIYSMTVVRTKPPLGLPRPYALGYVDLDGRPLRILMLLDPKAFQQLAIGSAVELAVDTLGVNRRGEPCLRPFFRPRTLS